MIKKLINFVKFYKSYEKELALLTIENEQLKKEVAHLTNELDRQLPKVIYKEIK